MNKNIVISIPCCCPCGCVRSMFPPDRPLLESFDLTRSAGMITAVCTFQAADPTFNVTLRTLTLADDVGFSQSFPVGDGTVTTFTVPGIIPDATAKTLTATLVDTNASGAGAVSAAVTKPIPPTPPVPVPPAPVILDMVLTATTGAKSKTRVAG